MRHLPLRSRQPLKFDIIGRLESKSLSVLALREFRPEYMTFQLQSGLRFGIMDLCLAFCRTG